MAPKSEKDVALKAVRAAFAHERRINLHHNPIRMDFNDIDGALTLEGVVPTEIQKEMAEFDAWYVFGVDKVVNKLDVRR